MNAKIDLGTISHLQLTPHGLAPNEIVEQKKRFGLNAIIETKQNPWLDLMKDTIKDPMLWLLVGVGSLFTAVGEYFNATILFLAVVPLFFMDAYLHFKSQKSSQTLRDQLQPTSRVLRSSQELVIDSQDIVPGDLILLKSGDSVPADGIFYMATDVQMDESILTGEAFTVKKTAVGILKKDRQAETVLDTRHIGYAGTRVLVGTAQLRIYAIAAQTVYGEIVRSVSNVAQERTPLQKSIDHLMRYLIAGALALCVLLASIRLMQGKGWLDAVLSAATLAVAAIPEEFPIVFSFFLGIGVFRLAKRKALVRRAVTVENIGRTTRICTDKTGTITSGQLQLTHFDLPRASNQSSCLQFALLASNENGTDPVDIAIAASAQESDVTISSRLKEFPFTEDRKRQATLSRNQNADMFCAMKGAPETILSRCRLTFEEKADWLKKASQWARGGHKVLACASKTLSPDEIIQNEEPTDDYTFEGLMAFEDPPRPEIRSAIEYCNSNHIGVLMLTGDHPDTATAVAEDIGLGGGAALQVVSAEDHPEQFTEEFLMKNPDFIRGLHVAARCTPLQKLWIVQSLKRSGDIVAVTGDGVNDVPALKAADIGIAMGLRGTSSAKEVSSIILADDNFESLVSAIREGRQLFANLKVSFLYLLLFQIPLVCTAAFIPLFGFPLLYLPIHTVWLELIIHPTSLFAFQNKAQTNIGVQGKNFFSVAEMVQIGLIGGIFCICMATLYVVALRDSGVEHARGMALALLSSWSTMIVLRLANLRDRGAQAIICGTTALSLCFIQIPRVARILDVSPLHAKDWALVVSILFLFSVFIRKPKSR